MKAAPKSTGAKGAPSQPHARSIVSRLAALPAAERRKIDEILRGIIEATDRPPRSPEQLRAERIERSRVAPIPAAQRDRAVNYITQAHLMVRALGALDADDEFAPTVVVGLSARIERLLEAAVTALESLGHGVDDDELEQERTRRARRRDGLPEDEPESSEAA